jgi:hypothetical protein
MFGISRGRGRRGNKVDGWGLDESLGCIGGGFSSEKY